MLRSKQLQQRVAERRSSYADDLECVREEGATLDDALLRDRAWRQSRRALVLGRQRKLDYAYKKLNDWLVVPVVVLSLMCLAGGIAFTVSVPLQQETLFYGSAWIAGASLAGISLLIGIGGAGWLLREIGVSLLSSWAKQQEIDLKAEPEEDP